MLSDHSKCIEKCVNATSESEKEIALETTREFIEWCLKEGKYFYLQSLLQLLHGNMEDIAPEVLLGTIRYMEPASDQISDYTTFKVEIELSCLVGFSALWQQELGIMKLRNLSLHPSN